MFATGISVTVARTLRKVNLELGHTIMYLLCLSYMRTPNTTCSFCNQSFYRRPKQKVATDVFCCTDPTCLSTLLSESALRHNARQRTEYIERWLRGEEDGMRGQSSLSHHIRNHLLKQADFKCDKCGWGETNTHTGRVPLEVNHKDGNFRNNSPANLEVLCPNCHSLTHHFRSLNKGNGRPGRKSTQVDTRGRS